MFTALAVTSETYFNALAKMGEQAMQSMSSRLLGKHLLSFISFRSSFTFKLHQDTFICPEMSDTQFIFLSVYVLRQIAKVFCFY